MTSISQLVSYDVRTQYLTFAIAVGCIDSWTNCVIRSEGCCGAVGPDRPVWSSSHCRQMGACEDRYQSKPESGPEAILTASSIGEPVSRLEFVEVLSNITSVRIRGGFYVGHEHTWISQVKIIEPKTHFELPEEKRSRYLNEPFTVSSLYMKEPRALGTLCIFGTHRWRMWPIFGTSDWCSYVSNLCSRRLGLMHQTIQVNEGEKRTRKICVIAYCTEAT